MNAKTFKLVQQTAMLLSLIILAGCQPNPSGVVDATFLPWLLLCGVIVVTVALGFTIGRYISSLKKSNTRSAKPILQVSKPSHSSGPNGNGQIAKQPSEATGAISDLSEEKDETVPQAGSGRIFISYRRSDSADIAGRIYDRLIGRFGKDPVFKDVDSIPLGLDFKEYLDKKVGDCDVLLAIIGDRWLDAGNPSGKKRLEDPADFVRIEIESALERGIPVIPLLVRGAEMPREDMLPPGLQKLVYRNGIPIRSDPDFHRDMDRLISALERYI